MDMDREHFSDDDSPMVCAQKIVFIFIFFLETRFELVYASFCVYPLSIFMHKNNR